MNKLLMKIKRVILLPLIVCIALGTTTPATAYSYSYNSLIKKILALLMPLLRYQNTNRALFKMYQAPVASRVNPSIRPHVELKTPQIPTIAKTVELEKSAEINTVELVQPALVEKPITSQATHHIAHCDDHDKEFGEFLDKLHTCIQKTSVCKQQFLNPNVTRSYREFKHEFDANLVALQVMNELVGHKHISGEQFKTFSLIIRELIQTQALMCDALNDNYGSGMTLGLSLAKIEKPTAAARANVTKLIAQLHKSLRGKTRTLKKLKTIAADINTLLAPPSEQGLNVMALWGICNKRVQ